MSWFFIFFIFFSGISSFGIISSYLSIPDCASSCVFSDGCFIFHSFTSSLNWACEPCCLVCPLDSSLFSVELILLGGSYSNTSNSIHFYDCLSKIFVHLASRRPWPNSFQIWQTFSFTTRRSTVRSLMAELTFLDFVWSFENLNVENLSKQFLRQYSPTSSDKVWSDWKNNVCLGLSSYNYLWCKILK